MRGVELVSGSAPWHRHGEGDGSLLWVKWCGYVVLKDFGACSLSDLRFGPMREGEGWDALYPV